MVVKLQLGTILYNFDLFINTQLQLLSGCTERASASDGISGAPWAVCRRSHFSDWLIFSPRYGHIFFKICLVSTRSRQRHFIQTQYYSVRWVLVSLFLVLIGCTTITRRFYFSNEQELLEINMHYTYSRLKLPTWLVKLHCRWRVEERCIMVEWRAISKFELAICCRKVREPRWTFLQPTR